MAKRGRVELGDDIYGHYRSIFNHCDVIGLSCRLTFPCLLLPEQFQWNSISIWSPYFMAKDENSESWLRSWATGNHSWWQPSWRSLQLRLPWKPAVLWRLLHHRHRISLAASVMSSLDSIMERLPTIHSHKNTDIPYPRPVSSTSCLRDLDSHLSRFQIPRGIPHEMPTSNPQDILAAIRMQRRSACSNRTGLSSILDIISRRRISTFGHIARLQDSVPARKALAVHVSSSLGRPQTPLGDADLDDHVAGGSTRSGGTPARLLPITGDRHKGEVIDVVKGRYGPRWLRDDDDDYIRD